MFVLGQRARTSIAAAALVLLAAAAAATPRIARGEPGAAPDVRRFESPRALRLAVVLPHRDPFAGGGTASPPRPIAPLSDSANRTVPPSVPIVLPPMPVTPAGVVGQQPLRISAIVSGEHPYAIADDGGRTRLVAVGDSVDGDRVVAIGAGGVRLAGGSVFSLVPLTSGPAEITR